MSYSRPSVTVSVWNDFWSLFLVHGLLDSGFTVLYHNTAKQNISKGAFTRNYPAAVLNYLARRKLLPEDFAFACSRKLVDQKAKNLVFRTDAFWGWSGCSLAALQAGQASGRPTILERGSTHCIWNRETLKHEYRRLNLSFNNLPGPEQISYELAEYDFSSAICVPSHFVLETFLEQGVPRKKIFVNPYGVNFNFWAYAGSLRIWQPPFTFVWNASLIPRKGIALLLDAWKRVNLKNAQLRLIGPIGKTIRPLLRNLPPDIIVLEAMTPEEVRAEMSKAHAFILPSFEEGLARSALEAAATGLPLIITRETGVTDIFQNGKDSWEILSGSVDAIAEILFLVSSSFEEAIRRGKNASRSVEPFSWDAYGQRASSFLRSFF